MKNVLVVVMCTALLAPGAYAHDGDHKVMGTVSTIRENHLEVKGTDGKTSRFTLNDKTKILRGKTAIKAAEIKAGQRIVVIATETKDKAGKAKLVAKEVRLGSAPAAPDKQ